MKKISNISKIAATLLAGSLAMTGCGSSSTTQDTTASASITIGASVVSDVNATGLTVTFPDATTCFNNRQLTATNGVFTIVSTDLNKTATLACSGDVGGDFDISVNPILASVGNKKLSDEIGIEPLKGKKGKQVNIFSTIAINTGKTVQDIDVNDATKPAVKALKSLIQLKMATGSSISTFNDVNLTALSNLAADANLTTDIVPTTITDLNVTTLNEVTALFKADSNVTSISDLNTSTVTGVDKLKTDADTAANSPKLSVSSISLTIGSNIWSASSNDFNITKESTQTVASTDDVVISINAAGLNDFNISNSTLKAVIANDASQELSVTLTGIKINSNADSATIPQNTHLNVATTNYSDITTGNANTNKDLNTSDLSFSLNTLATAFTATDINVTRTKQEIINALGTAGTYTVTVGLTGIDANASNLVDVNNSTFGDGYRGFTGTVTVK